MTVTKEMLLADAEIERTFSVTRAEIRAADALDRVATMGEKEWREIKRKRAWYRKNREKVLEQKKSYYQENKARINERNKAYYRENREEILAKAKERRRYGYESP